MAEAQLYTVRVWQHAGMWRAVVRAVGDADSQLFTAPEPLAAWLAQATSPTAPRDGAPAPFASKTPAQENPR